MRSIYVYLSDDLHKEFKIKTMEKDITMKGAITEFVERYVGRRKKNAKENRDRKDSQ